MPTKDNSESGQRQTSSKRPNAENVTKTGVMLIQLIGLKQMHYEFCRLYLQSLRGGLRQHGVTPEMEELYEWEYLEMEMHKADIAAQLRILTSFLISLSRNTGAIDQPDMFGGFGHFDLEGAYHFN